MKRRSLYIPVLVLLALVLNASGVIAQSPDPQNVTSPQAVVGTGFTYQGQLKQGGSTFTASCDMTFRLYDDAVSGALVGSAITTTVPVTNSLFTVQLDFGANVFTGDARWLDIQVRCPTGTGSWTQLTPRQALTPAPYAQYAPASGTTSALLGRTLGATAPGAGQVLKWNGSEWSPADDAIGSPGSGDISAVYAGYGLSGGGTIGDVTLNVVTTTIQQRVTGTCGSGNAIRVVNQDGAVTCEPIPPAFSGWSLTGNAGTNASINFVGTTDNVSLTLRANNVVGWRLAPNGTNTPNVIGGYSGNSISPGVYGAVIGGGGASSYLNHVTDNYGVIGGGYNNQAGDNAGTTTDRAYVTVGGGYSNTASAAFATIAGGESNIASGNDAAVGGGYSNNASAWYTVIGGGKFNVVTATYATIAGGESNIASGNDAVVGGGYSNNASSWYTVIGGGRSNVVSSAYSTVGGGYSNNASGSERITIGGGEYNVANGYSAVVGGGGFNQSSNWYSTVAGGDHNIASGDHATIPGGNRALASHYGEMAYASGAFANAGDAQSSLYVMRAATTDAGTWHDLYLNGSSLTLTVALSRTVVFDILVVGRSDLSSQAAGYQIKGVIDNNLGIVTLLASQVTTLYEDDPAWDVQITDVTNGALRIQVQGNGENIRWVAAVRTVEVQW